MGGWMPLCEIGISRSFDTNGGGWPYAKGLVNCFVLGGVSQRFRERNPIRELARYRPLVAGVVNIPDLPSLGSRRML